MKKINLIQFLTWIFKVKFLLTVVFQENFVFGSTNEEVWKL